MDRYQIEICRLAANLGFHVFYEELDDSFELWKDGKTVASVYEGFDITPLLASFESPELIKSYHKLIKAVDRTKKFTALYENGLPLEASTELPCVRTLASGNRFYLMGADLGPFQGYVCWIAQEDEEPKLRPAAKFHHVKKDFLKKSGLGLPEEEKK